MNRAAVSHGDRRRGFQQSQCEPSPGHSSLRAPQTSLRDVARSLRALGRLSTVLLAAVILAGGVSRPASAAELREGVLAPSAAAALSNDSNSVHLLESRVGHRRPITVPEPTGFALLGSGLALQALFMRHRSRRSRVAFGTCPLATSRISSC